MMVSTTIIYTTVVMIAAISGIATLAGLSSTTTDSTVLLNKIQ
jgi:hypothetical protein